MNCKQSSLAMLLGVILFSCAYAGMLQRQKRASGCDGNPCGVNTDCTPEPDGTPVCMCKDGFQGDPFTYCEIEEVDCYDNDECNDASKPKCFNKKCINPCDSSCGAGADCKLNAKLVPVCSCPRGTSGDPFESCS